MNASIDIQQPPAASVGPEVAPASVLVRIHIIPPHPLMFPTGNTFGTLLLASLLDAKLTAEGVAQVEPPAHLGELNHSAYIFQVSPVLRGVDVIKGALSQMGILPFSQIAWHDPNEQMLRVAYPGGSQFPLITPEEIEAQKARHASIRQSIDEALRELGRK